jgi:hypothetical protein
MLHHNPLRTVFKDVEVWTGSQMPKQVRVSWEIDALREVLHAAAYKT